MNETLMTAIIAILGSSALTASVTLFFTRRQRKAEINKTQAETASEEVETISKVQDLIRDMRIENVGLNQKNVELEKQNTDQARTIEILTARLESRDSQLASATKQLDLMRSLAEQSPIIETLRTQMESMSDVIAKLQSAQQDAAKMMIEKEKTMQEVLITSRNLEPKKPPRT